MQMRADAKGAVPGPDAIARYSPLGFAVFRRYLRWYLGRNLNAVRIAEPSVPPPIDEPTVFYANHPSWWDPIVLMYVLASLYPDRRFFGPMDAAALRRYAILERFGLFGVESGAAAGAAEFLRQSKRVLESKNASLCVTAQGTFVDARRRPVELKRGVAHLLATGAAVQAVPIGLEYGFWFERQPEALIRIGPPVRASSRDVAAIHRELETALETTLDELAEAAAARDAESFGLLVHGTRLGVGGIYDCWRRVRSLAGGRAFEPSHESVTGRIKVHRAER